MKKPQEKEKTLLTLKTRELKNILAELYNYITRDTFLGQRNKKIRKLNSDVVIIFKQKITR